LTICPAGQAESTVVPEEVAGHEVSSTESDTSGGVAHFSDMLCNQLLPPRIEVATFPVEQYDHLVAPPLNHESVEVSEAFSDPSELIFVHRA